MSEDTSPDSHRLLAARRQKLDTLRATGRHPIRPRVPTPRTRGQNPSGGGSTVVQRIGSAMSAATSPWTSSM